MFDLKDEKQTQEIESPTNIFESKVFWFLKTLKKNPKYRKIKFRVEESGIKQETEENVASAGSDCANFAEKWRPSDEKSVLAFN